jgi:glycosyltransferase 2 family protein
MKIALAWLKLVFSAILLWLIFDKLDNEQLWSNVSEISLLSLLMALMLQLASTLTAAYRWSLIQRWLGDPPDLRFYIKSYLKGSLFNQLLPTSIGGDAYRVLENGNRIDSHKEAFFGVFIDRIAGLLGLLLLSGLALIWLPDLLPIHITITLTIILVIGFSGALFGLCLHKLPRWRFPLWSSLQKLSRRFARVYRNGRTISIQLGLSVVTHLFSMLVLMTLGQSLGLDFELMVYLAVIPPVILLTLLPLSFAGWGIREGAMVGIFAMIGAPSEAVLAMSVIYGLTLVAASLPGLWFFIHEKQWWQNGQPSVTFVNKDS